MFRPALLTACLAAMVPIIIGSCFRCESGILTSKICRKGIDPGPIINCIKEDQVVTFVNNYASAPAFQIDMIGYDYDPIDNGRLNMKVMELSATAVTVRFNSWAQSWTTFMNTSYLACGVTVD